MGDERRGDGRDRGWEREERGGVGKGSLGYRRGRKGDECERGWEQEGERQGRVRFGRVG